MIDLEYGDLGHRTLLKLIRGVIFGEAFFGPFV
jgi:hypothetical protein